MPASESKTIPGAVGLPRILIIDDNPSIHRDFDLVLAQEGENAELDADDRRVFGEANQPHLASPRYQLDHALSGLEGIERVKASLREERPYQLAFVDIRMPGIDGVETIGRLWKLDSRIQIVICTAYADYSQEDLARRLGFTDKLLVLKKPFDSIEVTQLAITLTEKWHLAVQAALKLEQMELLVAQRTRKLLELQGGEPAAKAEALATDGEAAEPGQEPPLVLFVGSGTDVDVEIRRHLGSEYQLMEAKDGAEAFDLAKENVPDLILANQEAAGLDGVELCRRAKGSELTSHIPVLLFAAAASQKRQVQALLAGTDFFFVRPFNPQLIRARVNNLLQSRRKLQRQLDREVIASPREIATNEADVQFLRRTMDTVEQHMADFEFDMEALARKMSMSRRQLFRKLKGVAGCAPSLFIRNLRLKRAAQLLKESRMTVTEVTYAVGFSDLKHFRKIFQERFGVLPGEYGDGSAGESKPG